jgi:hypothetical protein
MNEIKTPRRPLQRSTPLEQVWWWVGGAILILVGLIASLVIFVLVRDSRPIPNFSLLASRPDSTLVGTVAYVDSSNCVRIIALRGEPSREVYCIPKWSPSDAVELGKPTSPQLVWLDDGKLEVTFFRMSLTPGPDVNKGWQIVVDVRTGSIAEVSDDLVPNQPNVNTRPITNANGDSLSFTSNRDTGKIKILVTDSSGKSRVLLDDRGPSKSYGLNSVFWGPDGKNIFADDGRILVIVPSPDPVVRILVDGGGGNPFFDDDSRVSGFAVTSEEFLS